MQPEKPQSQSTKMPPKILAGMWGLVAFAILSAATWRMVAPPPQPRDARPIATQYLKVTDGTDGSVILVDAATSAPVDTLDPGTSGFVRATLRGLARERKRQGFGPDTAFRLIRWTDGHLTLDDLATGSRIDLGAFGVTNAQAFARLMHNSEKQP